VEIRTDFPAQFSPGRELLWALGSETRKLTLASARPHGGRLLLAFEGVTDFEGARRLSGGDLGVAETTEPPPDYYYGFEVEGWRCEDPLGRPLGTAESLEGTPAGPLLSVRTRSGRSALVPFVRPIVVEVNRAARRIVLDPPEGLMEL
jgi:16S rRNA processing protein RimM